MITAAERLYRQRTDFLDRYEPFLIGQPTQLRDVIGATVDAYNVHLSPSVNTLVGALERTREKIQRLATTQTTANMVEDITIAIDAALADFREES